MGEERILNNEARNEGDQGDQHQPMSQETFADEQQFVQAARYLDGLCSLHNSSIRELAEVREAKFFHEQRVLELDNTLRALIKELEN